MLFDLHNDFPTALDNAEYSRYLHRCGDNTKITAVIWTSAFAEDALAVVTNMSSNLAASNVDAVAIEDIGFLADNDIYRTFDFSEYLYCSLTWNRNNAFAGGATDDGMLTKAGECVIDLINASGCAVDLAHLNKKSFYVVLDRSQFILCSHTGFNSHPRSLDDSMIRALIERRALIGLCTVSAFTNATDAKSFADVIDGFVQKYGVDNLALGTDFNGSDDIPKEISSYNRLESAIHTLVDRGYTQADINKILYRNALNFYNRRFGQ